MRDVRRIKQIRALDVAGEDVQVRSPTTRVAVHVVVRDQEACQGSGSAVKSEFLTDGGNVQNTKASA